MPLVEAGTTALVPALILLAAAVIVTAARVDAALERGDGEKLFWVGLTGLLTALLAIVWAVAGSPQSGPWVGLASMVGAAGALWWIRVRQRRRVTARKREDRRRRIAAATRRHDSVLVSWSSYELDAWKALEKPGIGNVDRVESKALMRAMKAAAALRPHEEKSADMNEKEMADYESAVAGLEEAWEDAENSAGGGRAA